MLRPYKKRFFCLILLELLCKISAVFYPFNVCGVMAQECGCNGDTQRGFYEREHSSKVRRSERSLLLRQ